MYPQFLTLILFGIATSFTPGPNNIMASHSGFNFGFKKTAPLMLGVIFGWTAMLICMEAGLIVVFQKFERTIQKVLDSDGSLGIVSCAGKQQVSTHVAHIPYWRTNRKRSFRMCSATVSAGHY